MLEYFKPTKENDNKGFDKIKESLKNKKTIYSWYPSAGNDYRDVIELTVKKEENNITHESPDIFIHSDYNTQSINFENLPLFENQNKDKGQQSKNEDDNNDNGFEWVNDIPYPDFSYPILFQNEAARVELINKIDLELVHDIIEEKNDSDWMRNIPAFNYSFNKKHVSFPEIANIKLKAALLDVNIISNPTGKPINKQILYFFAENIGLFNTVLLPLKRAGQLNLEYIIKVREGLGLGGGGTAEGNIFFTFFLLKYLGVKYLITDPQKNHLPIKQYNQIVNHNYLEEEEEQNLIVEDTLKFKLEGIQLFENWSGLQVKIFKIIDCETNVEDLREQLNF